jgi:hypothetical protein
MNGADVACELDDKDSILGKGRERNTFFATTSKPALGPTQPPHWWMSEA